MHPHSASSSIPQPAFTWISTPHLSPGHFEVVVGCVSLPGVHSLGGFLVLAGGKRRGRREKQNALLQAGLWRVLVTPKEERTSRVRREGGGRKEEVTAIHFLSYLCLPCWLCRSLFAGSKSPHSRSLSPQSALTRAFLACGLATFLSLPPHRSPSCSSPAVSPHS